MKIFEFSYDNENDALNSLSKYYGSSIDQINSKLKQINRLVKEKIDQHGDNGKYANIIRILLGAEPELHNIKIRVSYYHRCSSDGTIDWFKEGVLNCSDGLNAFVMKANLLLPNLLSEKIVIVLRSHLKHRTNGELFFQQGDTGVFAYSRLEEAREDSTYDFPEVFFDMGNRQLSEKLKADLRKVLKPTVVKFYKEYNVEDIDWIVMNYWGLVCQKFDEMRTHNSFDVGKGKTIPFEQIEEILMVGS